VSYRRLSGISDGSQDEDGQERTDEANRKIEHLILTRKFTVKERTLFVSRMKPSMTGFG